MACVKYIILVSMPIPNNTQKMNQPSTLRSHRQEPVKCPLYTVSQNKHIFLITIMPNVIKIDPYNLSYYIPFQSWCIGLRQSVWPNPPAMESKTDDMTWLFTYRLLERHNIETCWQWPPVIRPKSGLRPKFNLTLDFRRAKVKK